MPSNRLIPTRQAQLLGFSQNMYDRLTVTPEAYGVNADDVAPFAAAQEAFKAAFAKMENPETKNTVTIEQKNLRKKTMIAEIRKVVKVIQAWPAMTNDKRGELRIPVRDTTNTAVPPPAESPKVILEPFLGRSAKFRLENAEGGRARPANATSALLYTFVGTAAPEDIKDWTFQGISHLYKNELTFPQGTPSGSQVFLTACWVNGKGQPGPASYPVGFNLPGGGVSGNSLRLAA